MIDRGGFPRSTVLLAGALVLAAASAGRAAGAGDDVQDLIYLAPKGPVVIRLHLRVDGRPFSELHTAAAQQLFEELDTDHNGLLEGKELAQLPPADLLAATAKNGGKRGDGATWPTSLGGKNRVTSDELAPWLRPFLGNLFALVIESTEESAGKPVLDGPRAAALNGYQPAARLDLASLLALLDADGDGRVTVVECRRVDELFRLLDRNDDETISPMEISEAAAEKRSARTGAANPLSDVGALLKPIENGESRIELVRLVTKKYARLSSAEVIRWLATATPQFELDVALTKKSLDIPTVAVRRGPAAPERNGAELRDVRGQVVLALGPLPIELHAAESPPRPISRTGYASAVFRRADRDNNGYLDAGELAASGLGLGPDEFKAIDRDHNGMVFEDEWLAFMTLYEIVSEHRVTLTVAANAADPIALFDSNGDGRLTHSEWARGLATIRSWDANHDGVISPDEVPRQFVGTFHLGILQPSVKRPTMSDRNPSSGASVSAPAWFQKMDRNRDGEVSLREFLGPLSVFRRLDANHDGYLDAGEARKAANGD